MSLCRGLLWLSSLPVLLLLSLWLLAHWAESDGRLARSLSQAEWKAFHDEHLHHQQFNTSDQDVFFEGH